MTAQAKTQALCEASVIAELHSDNYTPTPGALARTVRAYASLELSDRMDEIAEAKSRAEQNAALAKLRTFFTDELRVPARDLPFLASALERAEQRQNTFGETA